MANFNRVLLIGNLTRDPQLSYLPSQTAVVEFGLAVNRKWTGKDGAKKRLAVDGNEIGVVRKAKT